MPFFIRNRKSKGDRVGNKLKGKLEKAQVTPENGLPAKKRKHDEVIQSESEDDDEIDDLGDVSRIDEEDENETPQEKRLRLAKQYLSELEEKEREKEEDRIAHHVDPIAHRLHEDVLREAGNLKRTVADKYLGHSESDSFRLVCKFHKMPITCVVISSNNECIYSASKDPSIVKWSIRERKTLGSICRKKAIGSGKFHDDIILSLALSSDDKFLASGDENKLILIWNPENFHLLHTFKGHRGPVSGLSFRKRSHQLFSCSHDRSVKIWDLDEMAYTETLYGHLDSVTAIDVLNKERAVTSGGRDGTVRVWKVIEESQLVFAAGQNLGSIDSVRLINEEHFLTCGDDGILSLWGVTKKKPLCRIQRAHGCDPDNGESRWITSIGTLQNTDLVASGSSDGFIHLWKCGEEFRKLTKLFSVPVSGFVNSLVFTSDGKYLIAGIGQEHRLGRWWRLPKAKNSLYAIALDKKVS